MADSKIKLTKADRFKAFLRSYFLLASFNYERMQNGGVAWKKNVLTGRTSMMPLSQGLRLV